MRIEPRRNIKHSWSRYIGRHRYTFEYMEYGNRREVLVWRYDQFHGGSSLVHKFKSACCKGGHGVDVVGACGALPEGA